MAATLATQWKQFHRIHGGRGESGVLEENRCLAGGEAGGGLAHAEGCLGATVEVLPRTMLPRARGTVEIPPGHKDAAFGA